MVGTKRKAAKQSQTKSAAKKTPPPGRKKSLPLTKKSAARPAKAANRSKATGVKTDRAAGSAGPRPIAPVPPPVFIEPPKTKSAVEQQAETDAGRYLQRGVSSSKKEVHAAIEKLDAGLYPTAFCKILPDLTGGDRRFCNIIHADGPGTKSLLAYLSWKETGDAAVFEGIAQDSIVMNVDDLLCVGVTGGMVISSTINRNARNIPGEIVAALIRGTENVLAMLRRAGVTIHSGGGETADVGDLTKTLVADTTIFARWPQERIIDGAGIVPGLAIVGLGSAGQARYEDIENSGIGSNGLTSARHDLLSNDYAKKYPETFDAATPAKLVYCGKFKLTDNLPGSSLTVGQGLLSPTRSYAPILKPLLTNHFDQIAGLIHCSGGGQTKCLRFGQQVHFIKDNLLPIPPIFACIQKTTGTAGREMFQVFNMGHRMEVYCKENFAPEVIATANRFGVDAAIVGRTEPSKQDGKNHLTIKHGSETLSYSGV